MSTPPNESDRPCEGAKDFEGKLFLKLSAGFSMLGVALGSRLGLFDIMSQFSEPMTSQQIADAAGFKERYVREWLGMMCTSDIVDLDDSGKKYYLPEHRRHVLTDISQLAVFSTMIPILACVEDRLVECFKKDGPRGIPYSYFPRCVDWREKIASNMMEWETLGRRLSYVPGLLEKLEQGIEMADLGTGSGRAPLTIAEKYPRSTVWGMDISDEGIATGQREAERRGLKNANFKVQDICEMPADWTNKWDFLCMFDVAHDVPFTTKMLKDVLRVLKPGAYFLMHDIDLHTEHKDNIGNVEAPMIYGISLYHCMAVSLNTEGGEGWGTAWGREAALGLLEKTGFVDITVPEGLVAICRKPCDT